MCAGGSGGLTMSLSLSHLHMSPGQNPTRQFAEHHRVMLLWLLRLVYVPGLHRASPRSALKTCDANEAPPSGGLGVAAATPSNSSAMRQRRKAWAPLGTEAAALRRLLPFLVRVCIIDERKERPMVPRENSCWREIDDGDIGVPRTHLHFTKYAITVPSH